MAFSKKLLVPAVVLFSFIPASFAATAKSDYAAGAAAYKSGEFTRAQKYFESALRQAPQDPNAHYGLAETFVALGKNERGLTEYRKTIELAPKSKLADYARTGSKYITDTMFSSTVKKMAQVAMANPLPTPAPPRYFAPEPTPDTSVIRTSYSGGYSAPLPQPSLPSYGPPPRMSHAQWSYPQFAYSQMPQMSYPQMSYPQTASYPMYGHHMHHGRHRGGSYGYGYAPNNDTYSHAYDFHVPQIEIRQYGQAPPLNIVSSADSAPEVELMAKQQRLIIDEKPSR